MFKHLLLIALLSAWDTASAQQQPSVPPQECFAPEQISRLKEKMSRYDWTLDPTRPAVAKQHQYFPPALFTNHPVTCVAVAVDSTGIVKEAIVYYPRSVRLSRDDRKEFMATTYDPAQVDGAASPSILIWAIAGHRR